ncbi:uncharacterized protein LOC135100135 [Scylla paramamosain]|uniref:uncharacterized protein LOC135100135 n=1 Tax=Scylla paramamosain TaxID=85552 RepID=UPI00308365EB
MENFEQAIRLINQGCLQAIQATISLLQRLGFCINMEKSVLTPTQCIEYLGNVINTKFMTASLPERRLIKIRQGCAELLCKDVAPIREVARVIGLMVAAIPAVELGKLHYRKLEGGKIAALKQEYGNFDRPLNITADMKLDLSWWLDNVDRHHRHIFRPGTDIDLFTDASSLGWGGHLGCQITSGTWSLDEKELHINILEMKAILFSLQAFEHELEGRHVRVFCDNTTAINYVNEMGGTKSKSCNDVATQIWDWCLEHDSWVTCSHIPGKDNTLADVASRKINDRHEWKLDSHIFTTLCNVFGTPSIDLFASRLNKQVPSEVTCGASTRLDGGSSVAVPVLDGHAAPVANRLPTFDNEQEECSNTPVHNRSTPHHVPHEAHGMPSVRENLQKRGVSPAAADIILASWKPGTERQYRPHVQRWSLFCGRRNVDPTSPTVGHIVNFLTETFDRGVGYECVNTARGALSSLGIVVDGCRAGNHPLVIRFMRGVFNLRTPQPRYTDTWDVQPVFEKLRSMFPLHALTLKELTLKLVMMMALTQAARIQTLQLLLIRDMLINEHSISVQLGGTLKQSRPNFNINRVTFHRYPKDPQLCVCSTLLRYIDVTKELRQDEMHTDARLLISFIKPHKSVSKDTIARWVRTILRMSGIDISKFSAGSVRPAAASKAGVAAVPVACIMAKAGWSRESTFAKYYNKNIVAASDLFQDAVLE